MNTKEKSHIINRTRAREQRKMANDITKIQLEIERARYQEENNLRNHRLLNQLAAMQNMTGNQFDILGQIYKAG